MIHAALDIGTTNITILAFDSDAQKVVSYHSLPNERSYSSDGYAYLQSVDRIEQSARQLLDFLPLPCASLCVTGQVHGILYYDRWGKAVSPLYTWLDKHAVQPVDGTTAQQRLLEKTGVLIPAGYGLITHYANRLMGKVPAEAVGFTGILEYISGRLIGTTLTASDPSCLATYGAFDPVTLRFDESVLAEVLGSGNRQFLTPAEPFAIAGYVGNIPVTYPVGDNQAGFYGMIADPTNSCLVSIGTSGQLSVYIHAPTPLYSMELRPFLGKGYLAVGATLAAGKAYETVHRFLQSVIKGATGIKIDDEALFSFMKEEAAKDEHIAPLVVTTTFAGTRRDEHSRGAVNGITLDNLTVGNLVRGTVDGIVDELYQFTREIGPLFAFVKEVVATGSAVRRNDLFRKAIQKSFGLPVYIAQIEDGAALGAACIGAVGTHSISETRRKELVCAILKKQNGGESNDVGRDPC